MVILFDQEVRKEKKTMSMFFVLLVLAEPKLETRLLPSNPDGL